MNEEMNLDGLTHEPAIGEMNVTALDSEPPWDTGGAPGEAQPDDGEPGGGGPGGGGPGGGGPGDDEPGDGGTGGVPDAAQCRNELEKLLDNGFTLEEIRRFSQDSASQAAIASGMTIARAATEYLRRVYRTPSAPARRGVPTMRAPAAGDGQEGNRIAQMTDEQFRAFSRRAMEAALAGRKVRVD